MQTAHFTECLVYLLSNLQSKIQYKKAFWYVIQCSVVNWYRRLAKMCRLRFQVILFCSYQTTRSHEREYRKLEFLRLLASSRLSIRPSAWNNSALTGRIFMFDMLRFLYNMSRNFKFTRIMDTSHEDLNTISLNSS